MHNSVYLAFKLPCLAQAALSSRSVYEVFGDTAELK